jgi:peptidoglycan/LPS O-acetylase OafA/YrhL
MGGQSSTVSVVRAPRKLGRRPVLDGIRGIAILLVMLMHTQVLANGYVGVDVFFALSGFLITTLLLEEWEGHAALSLRAFYERRARRLLPALGIILLACVIVNATLYPLYGWPLGDKLLTTALFVNNWMIVVEHAKLGSLAPTWSLAQEEQFYLLWPLLLLALLRLRVGPHAIAATLVLLLAVLLLCQPLLLPGLTSHTEYFAPLDRASELLFGALGAVLWHWRLLTRPGRRCRPDRRDGRWRTPVCLALMLALGGLIFDSALPERAVYLGAALLTVPLIINLLGIPDSPLARVIGCPPLRWMGRISYGLYLYHLLVRNVLYHYDPGLPVYQSASITFAVSIVLAALSWHLLESRVLRARPSRHPRGGRRVSAGHRLSAQGVR